MRSQYLIKLLYIAEQLKYVQFVCGIIPVFKLATL